MTAEVWKEEVQYIDDTPIRIVVDNQISVKRGVLMPHWHEEMEIDCVLKGAVCYTVEGVTYRLQQGDIDVVGSGMIHSDRFNEENTVEVYHPKENNAELLPVLMKIKSVFQQKQPSRIVLSPADTKISAGKQQIPFIMGALFYGY